MEEGSETSQSSGSFPLDLWTTGLGTLSLGHHTIPAQLEFPYPEDNITTSSDINHAYPTALLGFNCSLPTCAMSRSFEAPLPPPFYPSSRPESAQSLQTTYCLTLAAMAITPKSRKHI